MKRIIFFLALALVSTILLAQSSNRHGLGVSGGWVYLSDDKTTAPGLQLEYEYRFMAADRSLHLASCVEYIFAEEQHIGLGLGIGFSIYRHWEIEVGPGVMFEGDDHFYCIHLATSYEWDLGAISMGPIVEIAHTGSHYHLLAGVKLGYNL